MRPVVTLKLPPLPEQTALLGEEPEHANAAVNASNGSPAPMRHTTEAVAKRFIDKQWEWEEP